MAEAWFFVVLHALWLFLPPYVSNMAPVFVGGGAPIDGGRNWKDGRRVLGPGKTWRGLLLAPLVAAAVTVGLDAIARFTAWGSSLGFDDFGGPAIAFVMAYALGFGALAGDAAKSFFKRRRGMERGAMWLGFDQLDFVVGAFVVAWAFAAVLAVLGVNDGNWMSDRWSFPRVAAILVLTPALHLIVNFVGYKMGRKQVPW